MQQFPLLLLQTNKKCHQNFPCPISRVPIFTIWKKMAAKTFEFEDELPDLPLPELNDTLNLYLDTLRPFLSLNEFKEVEVIVRDFENGIGQKLHEKLRERACNNKNWVRIL